MKKQTDPQSQIPSQEEIAKKKEEHLKKIQEARNTTYVPCLHDACPECVGTGKKLNGTMCIHYIHCSCPKCSPVSYAMMNVTSQVK